MFNVGDAVVCSTPYRRGMELRSGVVESVARKYCRVLFTEGWPERAEYDRATGAGRGEGRSNGVGTIYTPEQYAAKELRQKRIVALRSRGLLFNWGHPQITDEQVAAIHAIMFPEGSE